MKTKRKSKKSLQSSGIADKAQRESPIEGEVLEAEAVTPDETAEAESSLPIETEPAGSQEDAYYPAARGEVVRYDPLTAYLQEISQYPVISSSEEKELALSYYNNKDVDAAYKLVTGNLRLVVRIARDYEKAARTILDLIQEGNIGLMEAVKNFDPYRGVRFPSYAIFWIKAYIIRYVIANWRLVKIGTTQAQRKLFFRLRKEKERLEQEGFYPAARLLAEKLDVRESDIIEMEQRLNSPDLSVDAPLQEDAGADLLSVLPSPGGSAEDALARKQIKQLIMGGLDEFAAKLNKKEEIIFKRRMLAEEKATLQDLAVELSLSRERIRQIEGRLKDKLKDFLSDKLGDAGETIDL